MPRDVIIYARKAQVISMEEVLSAMRSRGVPVEWHSRLLTEQDQPAAWTTGLLSAAENPEDEASISFEPLSAGELKETLEAYADVLREQDREALIQARTKYQLVPGDSQESERVLHALVLVLAKNCQGLICDLGDDAFYDAEEYELMNTGGPAE